MKDNPILAEFMQMRMKEGASPGRMPFVAISRQAGAGGHTLAVRLLEKLNASTNLPLFQGWEIFDQRIVDILTEEKDIHVSINALMTEEYHSEMQEYFTSLFGGPAHQFKLYKRTFELLRILGSLGKVVLVGRASPLCTRGMKNGIRIRLQAPVEIRIHWMMRRLHLDKATAATLVRKQDEERARLTRDFFSKDIDDPLLYDAVWDTHETPIETIADDLIRRIEEKAKAV